MEALSEVVRSGKARYIGFSEWSPEQIRAGLEVEGAEKLVSSQPQYNMIWRAPEAEVFGLCAEHGISQIVWSPLGQGVLTGKYVPGQPPPEGTRATSPDMSFAIERYMDDSVLEAVQGLIPIAEDNGLTMVQLALAWILRRDEVASAIVGASRPEQVHANAAASGVKLSDDTLEAIDEALDGVIVTGQRTAPFAREGVKHR
jgi:aryl-alcohol dehydrogenase-like predicted oxidoreductase